LFGCLTGPIYYRDKKVVGVFVRFHWHFSPAMYQYAELEAVAAVARRSDADYALGSAARA
jgi:hypothetical protein